MKTYLRCDVMLLGLFLAIIAWSTPINDALAIGGDDMFELCKAQLIARAPTLASLVENDQPWLYTLIIAKLFSAFGETALIPRSINFCCIILTVIMAWKLIGDESLTLEKSIFVFYLLTSTEMPTLSLSAMVEPPSFAIALSAVVLGCTNKGSHSLWRQYIAGALIALAAFIKLTSLMVVPSWLLLMYISRKETPFAPALLRVGLGAFTTTLAIVSISPTFSFDSLWMSHWRAHQATTGKVDFPFDVAYVFFDWTIAIPLAASILLFWITWPRLPHALVFSLSWLLVDFAIHSWHRPWFGYYSLHFAIPTAISAAIGTGWLLRTALSVVPSCGARIETPLLPNWLLSIRRGRVAELAAIAASIIVACWFSVRIPHFWNEIISLAREETAAENPFIGEIAKLRERAKWIYYHDNRLAFAGGVLQPPELILMTYKRFATGSLTEAKIVEIIQRYTPELLLLHENGELQNDNLKTWLTDKGYVGIMWQNDQVLFALPSVGIKRARSANELVNALDL